MEGSTAVTVVMCSLARLDCLRGMETHLFYSYRKKGQKGVIYNKDIYGLELEQEKTGLTEAGRYGSLPLGISASPQLCSFALWQPASSILIFSAHDSRFYLTCHGLKSRPWYPYIISSTEDKLSCPLAHLIFLPHGYAHRWAALRVDANPLVQLAVVRRCSQLRIECYDLGILSFHGSLGRQIRISNKIRADIL